MDYKQFLLEEYKSNWEYIKHTEEIRLKLYQLYIAITAAMLSVAAALYKFSNGDTKLIDNSSMYMSAFLALYGFLFILLMFNQKKSYEKYRKKNIEIRNIIYSKVQEELTDSFLNAIEQIKPRGTRFGSAFIAWLSLPLSISLASSVIFLRLFFV